METGKTVHGSANLAFDAAQGVTAIVEEMYRNISAAPLPLGEAPQGGAPGIAGLVHASVRKIIGATKFTADIVLGQIAPELDRTLQPGPHREAIVSALNGVCGDHLADTGNSLAIPMQLRVFLPPSEHATRAAGRRVAFDSLFEVSKRPVEIYPNPKALVDSSFAPTSKLLILVHGLSMNDRAWTSHQHNHAEALATSSGYTPVYALYNSGRNISTNGRALSEQLTGLLEKWPTPVESITLVGFSMGGLLARSAMHHAQQSLKKNGNCWLGKVDKAVYIGTPHHGAVMERGGFWLQKGLTVSPYTAPLSALGKIRSDGITDLRHGNVRDSDWQQHNPHDDNSDVRQPTPLAQGIAHYAIAATLSKRSGDKIGRLLGDGLVHPSSATGRHDDVDFDLKFPEKNTRIFYGLGHLAMLHDPRVMKQLEEWLGESN